MAQTPSREPSPWPASESLSAGAGISTPSAEAAGLKKLCASAQGRASEAGLSAFKTAPQSDAKREAQVEEVRERLRRIFSLKQPYKCLAASSLRVRSAAEASIGAAARYLPKALEGAVQQHKKNIFGKLAGSSGAAWRTAEAAYKFVPGARELADSEGSLFS